MNAKLFRMLVLLGTAAIVDKILTQTYKNIK